MWRGPEADRLRRELHGPVVAVAGSMAESDVDGHWQKGGASPLDDRPACPRPLVDRSVQAGSGKERVVDAGADEIQARLQPVEVLVQPAADDVVDLRVGQLGTDLAEQLLDRRCGTCRPACRKSRGPTRAPPSGTTEWRAGTRDRAAGTRRSALEHPAVALPVHLERARRAEHRRPLDVVVGRADVCGVGQEQEVLHVEDARGLVGAFEVAARAGRSATPRCASSSRR